MRNLLMMLNHFARVMMWFSYNQHDFLHGFSKRRPKGGVIIHERLASRDRRERLGTG